MKKRSKYRPKSQYANPVVAVLERLAPIRAHTGYLVDLKIKNHAALSALVRGQAVKEDITTLISASNLVEALWRLGFGSEYRDVVFAGHAAILEVARRFRSNDERVTLYAHEINALNEHIELHDAQMEVITVKDMGRALAIVNKDLALGRFESTRVRAKETA